MCTITSQTFIAPSLTTDQTFGWNGRTWTPTGEAIEPIEMYRALRAPGQHFAYDSESARSLAFIGGTYDVTYGMVESFHTYVIVNAGGGLVRRYRATDTRQLRNGGTW